MKKILLALMLLLLIAFLSSSTSAEPPTGINLGHDYTFQLVDGDLTASGVQYSAMDTTTTSATDIVLFSKSIDLVFGPPTGTHKFLISLYFEIYGEFRAKSSGTADVEWKPQVRNKSGTWTDLVAAHVDLADLGTSFIASTLKGYAEISSTIDEIPFDFRVLMKCDTTDEGVGKIKSGSYVRVIFRDITWGQ